MLVKITNMCHMVCSHCMDEAGPDGKHMSMETFGHTLNFIERFDLKIIFMSGGEPTDHPQFKEFVIMARKRDLPVMVSSNGMFMPERSDLLDLEARWQIINDPRYYPKRIPRIEHPNVFYAEEIPAPITPIGRSKNAQGGRMSPLCFNLRSITRSMGCFQRAILQLRLLGKMCIPGVNIDGSIVAGESRFCHVIGNVQDTDETLTKNIIAMTCSRCGLVNNLDQTLKTAIGEM